LPTKKKAQKKPKSVWVIEGGEYSDYRVSGIYSTKHNAQLAFNTGLGSYEMEINEWPLDVNIDLIKKKYHPFRVEIPIKADANALTKVFTTSPDYANDPEISEIYRKPNFLHTHMWAKDEKHAIKIASERRRIWILDHDSNV
jgi:hypothetical protein